MTKQTEEEYCPEHDYFWTPDIYGSCPKCSAFKLDWNKIDILIKKLREYLHVNNNFKSFRKNNH